MRAGLIIALIASALVAYLFVSAAKQFERNIAARMGNGEAVTQAGGTSAGNGFFNHRSVLVLVRGSEAAK